MPATRRPPSILGLSVPFDRPGLEYQRPSDEHGLLVCGSDGRLPELGESIAGTRPLRSNRQSTRLVCWRARPCQQNAEGRSDLANRGARRVVLTPALSRPQRRRVIAQGEQSCRPRQRTRWGEKLSAMSTTGTISVTRRRMSAPLPKVPH